MKKIVVLNFLLSAVICPYVIAMDPSFFQQENEVDQLPVYELSDAAFIQTLRDNLGIKFEYSKSDVLAPEVALYIVDFEVEKIRWECHLHCENNPKLKNECETIINNFKVSKDLNGNYFAQ